MKIGILFDLDGTLLDTLEDLKDATNYILRQFGCPERSLEEVRSFVGNGARNQMRMALPGREDDPDLEQVLAAYEAHYAQNCQNKTKAYDGILDSLEQLQKVFPVAVVSNKPDVAVKKLCKLYFGDVYARGVSSDCPRKPAPDMVYKAMDSIGVDRCIYVGDSEVDVLTAANAGVPCLSVTWGFRDRACLKEAGAKHFCHYTEDLLPILQEMAAKMENEG